MNRLTLDALAVLDAIDRRGSFAQAAEELHRVPAALTCTVQKLEADLGVKVFDHSGHRAKLTRTTGLLSGPDVLTVPTMQAKLDAHRMGLGVGFLPETLAHAEAAAGRLLIREVAEPKAERTALVARRTANKGRALAWWIDALRRVDGRLDALLVR